jgi:phosphoribosylanthranilate isomerase
MKIKVCGNTLESQIRELDGLGIDYAGLIFYEQSPRYALKKPAGFPDGMPGLSLEKVGVFVNATREAIMKEVRDFELDVVQLHGDETASFCKKISDQVKVIKAFRITDPDTNVDWLVKEYADVCDYYLFDKGSAGLYGGTGQKFSWSLLERAVISKPFFLSGGIGPGDGRAVLDFRHPFLYGIDVNSRFEISPGIKDIGMIREFVQTLKS